MTNTKTNKSEGLTKVIYKPDSQSTDEYTLIVDYPEVIIIIDVYTIMISDQDRDF